MPKPFLMAPRRTALFILVAVFLVCALPPALRAQRRDPVGPDRMDRARDIGERERQTRALELDKEHKRGPQEILAEVNEDFTRLRTLSEEMSKATSADNASIDYGYISETTAEIRKRSLRLKTNLALPAPPKEDKSQPLQNPSDGQLKPSLAALDTLIQSFIRNPVFSDSGAVDPQLAAKARRDLEGIISLSEKIRKSAEKLHKSPPKSS